MIPGTRAIGCLMKLLRTWKNNRITRYTPWMQKLNDLNERQRYDYAIFSAEIHVLQLFNPRLPMDVVRYYQEVLNELKNKKNGR